MSDSHAASHDTPASVSAAGIQTASPVPVFILVIIVCLTMFAGWCGGDEDEEKNGAPVVYYAPAAPVQMVEALTLEHECITPCSGYIGWRAKIRTEGRPVSIKFQGVAEPVIYPGEGDFVGPPGMRSGETFYVSPDPERPNIRVQVYRKISVPR